MATDYLAGLLARREELVAAATKDLPVPLWEKPRMVLRVRPIEHTQIKRQLARIEKASHGAQAGVDLAANATIIAAAVDEVLIGEGDGRVRLKLYDLKASLGFDEDAKVDGADLVRKLCLRDGDVMSLAAAVIRHSGYEEAEVDEALAGE
jgi:hypothetical protein